MIVFRHLNMPLTLRYFSKQNEHRRTCTNISLSLTFLAADGSLPSKASRQLLWTRCQSIDYSQGCLLDR